MAEVTEVRDSGVELIDGEIEGLGEEVSEQAIARLPEPTDISVDDTLGHDIQIRGVEFLGVASIDGTQTLAPMEAAMMGIDPENIEDADEVVGVDEETGEVEIEVDEAATFVVTEDGEMGVGVTQKTETSFEKILSEFETNHL